MAIAIKVQSAPEEQTGPFNGVHRRLTDVDDDESVREAISALVRSLGYGVTTFASAEDFLESDRVDDTSCLITDECRV
jgi:FixJ family two-component response regulator